MRASDDKLFLARVKDLLCASDGGNVAVSRYLCEREQSEASALILKMGMADRALFFGGYKDAQRKKLFCLPEYASGLGEDKEALLDRYFAEELSKHIVILKITGSKYRALSHSDYLGAILNLGCERDSIGDICVVDDCTAWIFCEECVAKLIESDLVRVAADKVTVQRKMGLDDFSFERKFLTLRDTIASARADCAVAALTNLSRERAKELIEDGFLEVNFCEELRADRQISEGDVLTVRKKGKFIIRSINERTAKGRIRLVADKYC